MSNNINNHSPAKITIHAHGPVHIHNHAHPEPPVESSAVVAQAEKSVQILEPSTRKYFKSDGNYRPRESDASTVLLGVTAKGKRRRVSSSDGGNKENWARADESDGSDTRRIKRSRRAKEPLRRRVVRLIRQDVYDEYKRIFGETSHFIDLDALELIWTSKDGCISDVVAAAGPRDLVEYLCSFCSLRSGEEEKTFSVESHLGRETWDEYLRVDEALEEAIAAEEASFATWYHEKKDKEKES